MSKIANMWCWVCKTEEGREVVSAEFAMNRDEIYMFTDGEHIISSKKEKGWFAQLNPGENFHGPFPTRQEAQLFVNSTR